MDKKVSQGIKSLAFVLPLGLVARPQIANPIFPGASLFKEV